MNRSWLGPLDQIGYLVSNIEESAGRWQRHFGLGPWTVFRNVSMQGRYRGEPVTVTMDVGLAYQGSVQIELIQVTNSSPSPYRDAEGRALKGMHHIAWVVEDLEQAVVRLQAGGLQVIFEAANAASKVAYLEDPAEPGALYEVIYGAGMREMIQQGIAAARDWDGSNPVQEIDLAQ